MRFGVAAHLCREGYDEAAVRQALEVRELVERHAHDKATDDELAARLDAAAREPWWESAYLPVRPFDKRERAAWRREMDFDPEPVIADVDVPTLLLYGTDDLWLPVDESVIVWRRHHPGVSVVLIDGASHELLRNGQPTREADDAVRAWLSNIGNRGKTRCSP